MPHLEVHTYTGQIFWLAVCFILLYVVMWKAVLPAISGVVETRGKVIADDLDAAESLKNQAEAVEKKYETLLVETRERAHKLIDESSQKTRVVIEKKRAELSAKLDEKVAKAEREIASIEKASIAAADKVSDELAQAIITKLKVA